MPHLGAPIKDEREDIGLFADEKGNEEEEELSVEEVEETLAELEELAELNELEGDSVEETKEPETERAF